MVGISLAPPARGGMQGLQWALMNLFIDASIDRLWRIGELPVAAGNNAANRGVPLPPVPALPASTRHILGDDE